MNLSFFQRRKILKDKNYLDLTPYRIHSEEIKENLVTVLVPRFENKILAKFFENRLKSKYFNIKLDEIGSAAWLAMDGRRTVGQIAKDLQLKFGQKIEPVTERLTKFYSALYLQGYISFNEIKKPGV